MTKSETCSRNTFSDLGRLDGLAIVTPSGKSRAARFLVLEGYIGTGAWGSREAGASAPTRTFHSLGTERLSESSVMNGTSELCQRLKDQRQGTWVGAKVILKVVNSYPTC